MKSSRLLCYFLLMVNYVGAMQAQTVSDITPNQFKGSDIERIEQAVHLAKKTSGKLVIPRNNANGTYIWKIDKAILLPSEITVILDNCTIQLSDKCRDNMFRSANVGIGIAHPDSLKNIHIVGIGKVRLKGADNPRATGDAYRTLIQGNGKGRVSYGSDAEKEGEKQRSDWRNNMIQIAYVDGFSIKNVTIENSHAWAMCFERTKNAEISAIRFHNPEVIDVNGKKVNAYNKDGIDLRHGCKYFKIDDISGITGDDFIALSGLDVEPYYHLNGDINSYQVTSTRWNGKEDDTEQIFITNCQANYAGIAIRASDNASIHHVYIDGFSVTNRHDSPPPYMGSPYTLYIGGRGYGKISSAGKINNIYAVNLKGDGKSLITIEAPITDCVFMNGIYTGMAPSAITYKIDKSQTKNIQEINLIKVSKN